MVLLPLTYGPPTPRPLRVLVADDDSDTADTLAVLLGMAGCEVGVADEGFAVVPVAVRFGPDACVLGVRTPGVDGWEVGRRLRARFGGRPLLLVAVTGVGGRRSADNSFAAGFDHHFVKPADPDDLYWALARFVVRSGPAAAAV